MATGRVRTIGRSATTTSGVERLVVAIFGLFSFGMFFVWIVALFLDEAQTSETFAYGAIAAAFFAFATHIALRDRLAHIRRGGLVLILCFYTIGPLVSAIPLMDLRAFDNFSAAYFEMASALTTTGASAIWNVDDVPRSVLLWRAMCAGFGGFVWLVAALAILAPLSIGGFEVDHTIDRRAETTNFGFLCASEGARTRGIEARALWAANLLVTPYLVVILLCWLALASCGAPVFDAICLALSAVSTTGFPATADGVAGYQSLRIEIVLVCVMIPAAVGVSAHVAALRTGPGVYLRNPEIRYMGIAVSAVVAILFLRHWIGAIETSSTDEFAAGLEALWGNFFMAVSFITTTGFESASWTGATAWSGLKTPGVALIGLAMIGGGAASTAGGIKLIRAALLAKHSLGELRRLSRPSSVQPIFSGGRAVSFEALRIVWVFVMLYFMALAACALGLTASGLDFIEAVVASVSAMSNTGPLMHLITGVDGEYATLSPLARYLLCAGMVVGRMETLAVVALFSLAAWRR